MHIRINLSKLKGAFVCTLKGKTATKRCLCIPITEADLEETEKGIHINLTVLELKNKAYQTHLLKQSIDPEVWALLTIEQRKQLPIIGGIK